MRMDPMPRGSGALFSDPSADHARQAFAGRQRTLTDKLTTVADAVTRLVDDGDYLAVGGFGSDRIPTAVLHEVLRQRKQNLRFAGHTATHDMQLLCAGNFTGRGKTLTHIDAAYIVGLEARGLSPHARRVVESGDVICTEWSNYTLALRYKAAAMGLSFLPARSLMGTDTFARSAAATITCPFTGQRYSAIPALYPDVAMIHVHEADRYGNCRLRGTTVADFDLARAAKKLIITCERLIPNDEIRRDPSLTIIPFFCVDAVCEVPFGSYPCNMPYEYFSDEAHLQLWLKIETDPVEHKRFLDEYIFGLADFNEYLHKCGGIARLQELRREELLLDRGC
jgi:glutaconate CoA-transferase subunit A